MNISFTKMHGLGNDFVVIDAFTRPISLSKTHIRQMADRHFGIGFDQLLMVEKPSSPAADFRYRIFNADGGEVEQCGNGARCFVRFVHEHHLTDKTTIAVETASGIIYPSLQTDGQVSVDMGVAKFSPAQIPFIANEESYTYQMSVGDSTFEFATVSMGNPHAVCLVDNIDTAPVAELGALLESHPRFPNRVNVGFMQVIDTSHINLRVFERGCGETLACGTGACAAAVSGIRQGLLHSPIRVTTRGGDLTIAWQGEGHSVLMTGPAVTVFHGEIELA
jgi:diaminopimelate epimerase